VKIKHIVLGFFGALFVTTLIFQAPILAWAQNTALWYGSQGGKVWTLASGGTITANSGSAVTLAGTNTISGATTISAPFLRINPFMTYAKCGVTAVAADSSAKTIAVSGLVATDAVFAMTAEDTACAVVRAFVDTPGSLKIVVAGTVTSDNTDGMKVSWFAIRPQ